MLNFLNRKRKKQGEKNQMADQTTEGKALSEIVHPDNDGFKERVTAKSPNDLHIFKCAKCGKAHFRHAGYIQTMLPFMRAGNEKRISLEREQVMVCISCKKCYIWVNEQMYDVTDMIDLQAWDKSEKEMHKATGPGGQC